jgi:DNA-binding MarR family transcriptional regulator
MVPQIIVRMSVIKKQEADEIAEDARALRTSLTRIQRRLRAERIDARAGLSSYSALGCLYRGGPMSAGELAAAERLQPQSLTRILAALEEQELITRAPDQADLRRSRLAITPLGLDVLRRNARHQEAWLGQAIAKNLSATERGLLRLAVQLLDLISGSDT